MVLLSLDNEKHSLEKSKSKGRALKVDQTLSERGEVAILNLVHAERQAPNLVVRTKRDGYTHVAHLTLTGGKAHSPIQNICATISRAYIPEASGACERQCQP
jgi:hypothetical protein